MQPQKTAMPEVVAAYCPVVLELNAATMAPQWEVAVPVVYSSDWQGNHPDPQRETQVRLLWSEQSLYLRFACRYRELLVFQDAEPNGRRDHLWDRDVAEVFLQPDPSRQRYYKEFEVSPNGMWVDLDIFPGGRSDLQSGMARSVFLDEASHVWTAELAIPVKALTTEFDPGAIWRVNFFRVEGKQKPRSYFAWQPTGTPEPNFHVPDAFGSLRFAPRHS